MNFWSVYVWMCTGISVTTLLSFSPGPVASSTSAITVSPSTLIADGNSTTALTVTALDAYSNVVPNVSVSLAGSGGNNTFTPRAGATDANGQFSATLASTQVQTESITASFASGAATATNVSFVAGPASSAYSTLNVTPASQVANNSNVIVATLTLQDAFGHLISGATPTFTASGTSTTVSSPNATDASGQTTATFKTTLAQNENVVATAGSLSLLRSIVFVAGPPTNANATLTASPNANLYASGTQSATLRLTLADAFGNAAGNQNVTWSASSGNNSFTPATGVTNTAGVLTAQLTTITAGTRIVQATSGAATPTASVSFVAGGYAPASSFVASPNQVSANGNTQVSLTLTARDGNTNLLPNAGVTLVDTVPNHVFTPATGTTDSNGMFTAKMTATQAGKQTIAAHFAGAQLSTVVTFNPLATNCAGTAFYDSAPWPATGANSGYDVVAADFNSDGNQDIAVLNFPGTVQVMLGRGNQRFASPAVYNVGGAATALAIGDLNNDGIYDLATCNAGPNTASVLMGNANGTFRTAVTYAVGSTPRGIVIKDLNGDGNADIAVTNQNSNNVSVLYNRGNGLLNTQVTFPAGPQPFGLAAAPIVNSNANDLVVTNFSTGQVSLLANSGNNTFSAPAAFSVGASPKRVAVDNLNGDSLLDLAVINSGESTVSVLMNQGSATFSAQQKYNLPFTGNSLALAAMNGNTLKDIIVTSRTSSQFLTLANAGNGNFVAKSIYSTPINPSITYVADVNNDNLPDVLMSCSSPGAMMPVFYNRGGYSFQSNMTYAGSAPIYMLSGDYDGDGYVDLFVVNYNSAASIYWGQASGSLAGPTSIAVGGQPVFGAQGDINGDGTIDFVILNAYDKTVSVVFNQNNRSFASQVTYATGSSPTAIGLGDLDGNGSLDIAVSNSGSNTISFLKNAGNGNLSAVGTPFVTGSQPTSIALADFNADGLLDFIVTNSGNNNVTFALNQNQYTFLSQGNITVGSSPAYVNVGDFNGDGAMDAVTANKSSSDISILTNQNNTFVVTQSIVVGSQVNHIAVADLNGDAIVDLAVTVQGDNAVGVLYGSSSGTFGVPVYYPTKNNNPAASVVADFDSNGYADFAFAHFAGSSVNVSLWTSCR